ncbi:MAG TPA: virulence factor [Candidatus Limnocylindrales bacterium]|nr:virulence factor [Candidatus Limnocylindrales bacterium]
MGSLTVIWWRDIPAQVLARDGRRASKVVLHPRFQVAIDKAASRAGKRAYGEYIEEWHKIARGCGDDLEAEVNAEVERLETEYDKRRLAELIQTGGVAGGSALAPASDETQNGERKGGAASGTATNATTASAAADDDLATPEGAST